MAEHDTPDPAPWHTGLDAEQAIAKALLCQAHCAPPDEQARIAEWCRAMLRDPRLRPSRRRRGLLSTATVAAMYDVLQRHRAATGAFAGG